MTTFSSGYAPPTDPSVGAYRPLVPAPPTAMSTEDKLTEIMGEIQLINGNLVELRLLLARVLPLVEHAERYLKMTPMERLRAGLSKQ